MPARRSAAKLGQRRCDMTKDVKIQVGGTLRDDLVAFKEAWKRAEAGDDRQTRVIAFESWEGLASVMTKER